jgi:anti-sigma regulatory factor (Ser/Thr protein kinase)
MAGRPWLSFGVDADPAALRVEIDARAEQLVPLRRALRSWLEAAGANEDDTISMQIAAAEAAANAVEHAYHEADPGTVWLAAELEEGSVVCVQVGDEGRWRPQRGLPSGRGRGMLLMRECVDDVNLARSPEGTTVVLRLRLNGTG